MTILKADLFLVLDQINLCHHLRDNDNDDKLTIFCDILLPRNVTTTQDNVQLPKGRMHT